MSSLPPLNMSSSRPANWPAGATEGRPPLCPLPLLKDLLPICGLVSDTRYHFVPLEMLVSTYLDGVAIC